MAASPAESRVGGPRTELHLRSFAALTRAGGARGEGGGGEGGGVDASASVASSSSTLILMIRAPEDTGG